jgi:Sulfotransferase family
MLEHSVSENYRIRDWTPPERPEWVKQINQEGTYMDIQSVVPLNENSLLYSAKANTGLNDFGEDDWYEPFQIFLKSLEEDAELNLMGRLMTRSELLMYLEARLRIEDTFKKHPEIADQELAPPILITGSGRSGTSAIQNLMSYDPDNGTPRHWEALFPCPPPEAATYHTDPRIELADKRMTQYNRVCPSMSGIHEWGGTMPTENIQLETMTFQSPGWMVFCGHAASWERFIYERNNNLPVLRYTKKILQLLQWKNPRKRWLLKNPVSLQMLPETFEVFPDTKLLWMHRDPIKTMSSVVSLIGTIYWSRSDKRMSDDALAQLTDPNGLANLFNTAIDQIESNQIPRDQITHVQYMEFIKDPLATVEKAYQDMGENLSSAGKAAMAKYIADNPREKRPTHKYSIGDPERFEHEWKLFERYMTYFNVIPEVSA